MSEPIVAAAKAEIPSRTRLDSLTSLRFFAAALVMVHHACYLLLPGTFFNQATRAGYVGVGFFFALSGFVLMWSYSPGLSARRFYGRRFARIYPLHAVTAVTAVALLSVWGLSIAPLPAALNVALLQSWVPIEAYGSSLNGVSWSLCCEAFFYAMFPLIARRAGAWNLRLLVGGVLAAMVLGGLTIAITLPADVAQQITYKGPAYRIGSFVLGIAAAVAIKRGVRVRVRLRTLLGLTVVSYAAAVVAPSAAGQVGFPNLRMFGDWAALPVSMLLILALASADLEGGRGWLRHPIMVRLGEASFALYMVHYLILLAWVEVAGVPSNSATGLLVAAVLCLVAVGISLLTYLWLEHPAERRLRARFG